jgi:glycosyltransferase involved in cell wall biosynthesis
MPSGEWFPKILILCHEPINRIGGGGVTMGNLFRGWPQDALAQVWAHHRFEIDQEICPHYLRLGDHRMPGDNWVPEVVRRQRVLVKRLRSLLRPGVCLDYDRVLSWACDFGTEVIYSQVTPFPMYTWWLPRWLSRDLGVPLVNHIMDDWPTGLVREWPLGYCQIMTPFLNRQLRLLFKAGVRNLAISRQMVDAFQDRYGVSFTPFHNVIDPDQWAHPKSDYTQQGKEFRVVYLGALAEDMQVLSLRDVARSISTLSTRGVPISLTIHTGDIHRSYFEQYLDGLPGVSHGGMVTRKDLCAVLSVADLLVIPVNFGDDGILARFSMPTKVPEYMASGAPVLVYAPEGVPPTAYAREEGWGYVVDRRDPDALEQALLSLVGSQELRTRLGQLGRELALQNHDARVVREDFHQLLRTVVGESAR